MRLRLLLLIGAGALGFYGWKEFTLTQHAKPTPADVSAADLEAGKRPDNCNINLTGGIAIYPLSVYHYTKSKYSTEKAGPATKTSDVHFPVVSTTHPFAETLKNAGGKAPDTETVKRALSSVSIIVKTNRFGTVGSIPTEIRSTGALQGMILNDVEKIGDKELDLLRTSFPQIDSTKLIIIEEGRTPQPIAVGIGALIGGAVLGLGTIVTWFGRK